MKGIVPQAMCSHRMTSDVLVRKCRRPPFLWSHGRRPCAAVSKAILNVESDVSKPPCV